MSARAGDARSRHVVVELPGGPVALTLRQLGILGSLSSARTHLATRVVAERAGLSRSGALGALRGLETRGMVARAERGWQATTRGAEALAARGGHDNPAWRGGRGLA